MVVRLRCGCASLARSRASDRQSNSRGRVCKPDSLACVIVHVVQLDSEGNSIRKCARAAVSHVRGALLSPAACRGAQTAIPIACISRGNQIA